MALFLSLGAIRCGAVLLSHNERGNKRAQQVVASLAITHSSHSERANRLAHKQLTISARQLLVFLVDGEPMPFAYFAAWV